VVNQRQSVKLTFGDADSQQNSPMSKRLKLVTDSIDCLADLREHPTKSSTVPGPEDEKPRKFRLLFGGSSEELSQQLSPGAGEHKADGVDEADSDATSDSQSKPSSDSESSESERDEGKDEDVMTQADEEAMKTYVPLNVGALSYISDGEDNVLDFFLEPPNNDPGTTNCRTMKLNHSHLSAVAAAAAASSDNSGGNRRVKSRTFSMTDQCNNTGKGLRAPKLLLHESTAVINELIDDNRHSATAVTILPTTSNEDGRTFCMTDHQCNNTGKELDASELLLEESTAVINELIGDKRRPTTSVTTLPTVSNENGRNFSVTDHQRNNIDKELDASKLLLRESTAVINELIGDKKHSTTAVATLPTVSNEDSICSISKDNLSETMVSTAIVSEVRSTIADGIQDSGLALCQAKCPLESQSQGSDDFRTPASQNSTSHRSVIVVDCDMTSRSAGSQPLDSDSTVDIGCSPVKNRLQSVTAAGTSPNYFASDGTTTDGWCTPRKSSVTDVTCPQSPSLQLTNVQLCTRQQPTFVDQSLDIPQNPCSKFTNISSTASGHCVSESDAKNVFFGPSVPDTASSQSPGLKFVDVRSSTGSPLSNSPVNVQAVPLCQNVSSASSSMSNEAANRQVITDNYDGDVDSDSDDVIDLCVGVRRTVRRRLRSRSTSADTVVISSDSDQSPLLRSRDRRKDGVCGHVDVTTVSSGSESDDGSEADYQRDFVISTSAIERSPVLFSESSS